MREFYFQAYIEREDVTRDEVEAYVRHHFDQQDGVIIEEYQERFEYDRLVSVRVSGRALRKPA